MSNITPSKPDAPTAARPSGGSSGVTVSKPAVIDMPSPNKSSRNGAKIDTIVLHHTAGGGTAQDTGRYFQQASSKVSSNYVIGKDGTIVQPVSDDMASWHAGESEFKGRTGVNAFSLGIEIVNRGDGNDPYPDEQYKALAKLVLWMQTKYGVPWERITGHKDVAVPRGRKSDPSSNFSYDRLRKEIEALTGGKVPKLGPDEESTAATATVPAAAPPASSGGSSGSSASSSSRGSSGGSSGPSAAGPMVNRVGGGSRPSGLALGGPSSGGGGSAAAAVPGASLLANGDYLKDDKETIRRRGRRSGKPISVPPAIAAVVSAIKNDPVIQEAFKDWGNLSTPEKLEVGERISKIMGDEFDFEPLKDVAFDQSLVQPGEVGKAGIWSSEGKIGISAAALADPAKFLNVLTHEQGHEWEYQQKIQGGQHQDGDRVYEIGDSIEAGVFGTVMVH